MNTYVIIDETTRTSAIVDPGGDPDKIMQITKGTNVDKLFITHGHFDHVLAVDDIKKATGAEIYIHPAEALEFDLEYDQPLTNGEEIKIGSLAVLIHHIPGHTPGQCCIDLKDGRILVGDALFVGGPGKTATPEDFSTTMDNLKSIVFKWPDETEFFPGHGPSGTIGIERPAFEAFLARGWPAETCGDVTWEE
jgi:glyoxylase-like metal-dependent hydrolase (beta-lactamase superfamily II)